MFFLQPKKKYMKRNFLALFILLNLVASTTSTAVAQELLVGESSASITAQTVKDPDARIAKLKFYLQQHNSPLTSYAHLFVAKADEYSLPNWQLVAAITGVESTFGKRIPHNTYNAYGWANGNYAFASWEDSINHVSKILKEKYVNRGLNTVEKIAPVYAPPSTTWAGKVNFFINSIENFVPHTPETLSLTI